MPTAFMRLLVPAVLVAAPASASAAEPPIQRPSTPYNPTPTSSPAPTSSSADPAPPPATARPEAPPPAPLHSDADQDRRRRNAALGGAGLAVSLGAAIGAGVLAHLALRPTCADANNPMTCEIPTGANLRQRGGILGGAAVLSLTGAVFGGLGTRGLMRNTGYDGLAARQRRRTVATAAGSGAVLLGVAGIATGIALTSVGFRRATKDEQPALDPADPQGTQQAIMHDADARLDGIRLAGTGLALALSAPTALTIGIALLRNRPDRPDVARLRPHVTPTYAGATLAGSF